MNTLTTNKPNEKTIGSVTITFRQNEIHYKIPDEMSSAQFRRWKKTHEKKIALAVDELIGNN